MQINPSSVGQINQADATLGQDVREDELDNNVLEDRISASDGDTSSNPAFASQAGEEKAGEKQAEEDIKIRRGERDGRRLLALLRRSSSDAAAAELAVQARFASFSEDAADIDALSQYGPGAPVDEEAQSESRLEVRSPRGRSVEYGFEAGPSSTAAGAGNTMMPAGETLLELARRGAMTRQADLVTLAVQTAIARRDRVCRQTPNLTRQVRASRAQRDASTTAIEDVQEFLADFLTNNLFGRYEDLRQQLRDTYGDCMLRTDPGLIPQPLRPDKIPVVDPWVRERLQALWAEAEAAYVDNPRMQKMFVFCVASLPTLRANLLPRYDRTEMYGKCEGAGSHKGAQITVNLNNHCSGQRLLVTVAHELAHAIGGELFPEAPVMLDELRTRIVHNAVYIGAVASGRRLKCIASGVIHQNAYGLPTAVVGDTAHRLIGWRPEYLAQAVAQARELLEVVGIHSSETVGAADALATSEALDRLCGAALLPSGVDTRASSAQSVRFDDQRPHEAVLDLLHWDPDVAVVLSPRAGNPGDRCESELVGASGGKTYRLVMHLPQYEGDAPALVSELKRSLIGALADFRWGIYGR